MADEKYINWRVDWINIDMSKAHFEYILQNIMDAFYEETIKEHYICMN